METKLGQEPAFPEKYINADGTEQALPGINKRFYAACAAMQGFLANPNVIGLTASEIINDSLMMADELLEKENA